MLGLNFTLSGVPENPFMMTIKAHSDLLSITILLGAIRLRPVGALAEPVARERDPTDLRADFGAVL
jgi:hypothetical protein